jgi:DNA-binding NarL/FixJ family response regulator
LIRVAVVDDHPVARLGISAMLAEFDDLQVAYMVAAPSELPHPLDGLDLDVILLDLYRDDGHPALKAITDLSSVIPVIVFSASRAPLDLLAAMQAGASGYVTKDAAEASYAEAIHSAAAGEFYLSAQLADMIRAAIVVRPPSEPHEALTRRELEALGLIARGFTHRQAANRMGVARSTVDTHVSRIRAKLRLGNKADFALTAMSQLVQARNSWQLVERR